VAAGPPPPDAVVPSGARIPAAVVVALFLLCAVCWSLVVPPFESPDEIGHARYVNFLRAEARLPVPGEAAAGEAHQPPLYYALAAALAAAAGWDPIDVQAVRNPRFVWYGGAGMAKYLHTPSERPALAGTAATLHRLRLASALMAAGTVWLVWVLARRAGVAPVPAALVAALAAFTPQFTFISASLNNDNLANLASAACLAALMGAVARRGPGAGGAAAWIAAGCAAGVGLLAKFTTLTLLGAGVVALWLWWRAEGHPPGTVRPREAARRAAAFFLPALAVPAPLLAWNTWSWGDPFGAGAQLATLPQLVDRKPLLSAYFVTEFPQVLWRSFWGNFGWMSFPLPWWLDLAFTLMATAALLGLALAARRGGLGAPHALAAAAIAMQVAQVVIYNLTFTQAQGRFLFPVIGPVMLLTAAGLGALAPRRNGRSGPALSPHGVLLLCGLMACGSLLLLRLWVAPAYRP
jgi:hypothetical protein